MQRKETIGAALTTTKKEKLHLELTPTQLAQLFKGQKVNWCAHRTWQLKSKSNSVYSWTTRKAYVYYCVLKFNFPLQYESPKKCIPLSLRNFLTDVTRVIRQIVTWLIWPRNNWADLFIYLIEFASNQSNVTYIIRLVILLIMTHLTQCQADKLV